MTFVSLLLRAVMYSPKYFKPEEFTRCVPSCKLTDMDERLLRALDEARERAKMPFVLTSAYRSVEHEIVRGRSGSSSHTKGLAVDIQCGSSYVRYRIVDALLSVGFKRIGLYGTFIHADLDDDKISAIWLDDQFICRG